jgi:hypothetical protein
MRTRFIVVDDFYRSPEQIVLHANNLEYRAHSSSSYPGKNSTSPIYDDAISKAVSRITGIDLEPAEDQICGGFRISYADSRFTQNIHTDPSDAAWAGVLYLNADCERYVGTCTWRHKALGISSAPASLEEAQALGFDSLEAARQKLLVEDGLDRNRWEVVNLTHVRFNRLVLFRPMDWHSHGELFDGRLVQLFFWQRKADGQAATVNDSTA